MELQMRSHEHDWQRRLPDWTSAACAGLVGGAVLMVLELLWAATVGGGSPWLTSRMIAAITLGPDTLQSSTFHVGVMAVALGTHYVLGIVFGLVLATIIAGFHYESNAVVLQVLGVVFGAVLYLINFHAMSAFFPWIAELRSWANFIGHLVFGLTVVLTYQWLERTGAGR
jgi:hypothetical protein